MTNTKSKPDPKTRNPFYKGATPQMVARALARPVRKDGKVKQVNIRGKSRSSI